LFGARIVVLLEEISELPLLPVCSKPETDTLGEATRLEVEYGLALIEYMLEVACGFYNNMISLEGRTNKTAILLVEFWWWLHRKADYILRTDLGKRDDYPRVPGASLVSYRRMLHDANEWSGKMLFNHLTYAAMRCTDQGLVILDQLLGSIEIGTRESLQQMAQYKEATLVQQGPARDAFVEAVSWQMNDRLQRCRQYVRDSEAKLSTTEIVTSTAPLTLLPAVITENDLSAGKRQKKANKANKNQNPTTGVRRSARIAAARSMTVAAMDSIANDNEPAEQARKLMLLAQACATHINMHWKKPRLPDICRTRAGLDLYCRPYGGRCRTRTDICRPAPCQPSGSKPVPVRHWPVLDQTGQPTGRQDRLPGRHMLRHCYSGRSQAGSNDMYL
jgi:hypothetical protein